MPPRGSKDSRRPAWRTLLVAHGPRIATWVLAAALGVQAAVIVTDLARQRSRHLRQEPALPVAPRPSVDLAALDNGHLFGVPRPRGDAQ